MAQLRCLAVALVSLEPAQQLAVSDLLKQEGYSVVTFAGAGQAVAALSNEPPDLFVGGLSAPDLEGWRLCRLVRSSPHVTLSQTPILLLSGTLIGEEAERITAALGGDGLLPLPLDTGRFAAAVRRPRRTPHEALEESYSMLFARMLDGCALHEMIFDAEGRPADYRFLFVNPAFEQMTGLRAGAVLGKTVLEALPDTERSWIENYGRVVLTGEPCRFENYHAGLGKHFEVMAFRPREGQFACVFRDITGRRRRRSCSFSWRRLGGWSRSAGWRAVWRTTSTTCLR